MKKIYFLFAVILLMMPALAGAQEYSTSVTCVDCTGDILTVRSIGLSDKKKNATEMAVRSAFYTLLYRGVSCYNDGKPLVSRDNKFYVNKLLDTRYVMFVRSSRELGDPAKAGKMYKAEAEVEIMIKSLVKDLVFEKLMDRPYSEMTMQDTKREIDLPSIIVIPYKRDEEIYRSVLQNDFDRRIAVSRVQEGFNKLGVTTIDFEARLEAWLKAQDFNTNSADSEEKSILQTVDADVYVTVDINKDISATEGSRVSIIMKAYDTKTGNVLATSQKWTERFYTSNIDELCIYAVEAQLKEFLDDITVNFAKAIDEGLSVVLRISQDQESSTNLNSPVGDEGYLLSSMIRRWVKANAQNGRYHLKGLVPEEMFFDEVKIPAKDSDGLPMDAAQFGDNLLYYLNTILRIPAEMKVDGRSIYITIK